MPGPREVRGRAAELCPARGRRRGQLAAVLSFSVYLRLRALHCLPSAFSSPQGLRRSRLLPLLSPSRPFPDRAVVVQSLARVHLFATPSTAAASLP